MADQQIVTPGQGNVQVPPPGTLSYEQARLLGKSLAQKEKAISSLYEKIQYRQSRGTDPRIVAQLQAEYDAEVREYQRTRGQIGEATYAQAREAAPKDYRAGGLAYQPELPPEVVQSIPASVKYSQPGSITGGGMITETGTAAGVASLSSGRYLQQSQQPGVYVPTQGPLKGQQVIITQGRPRTAGDVITQLRGQPFTPGRLSGPLEGDPNKVFGIKQGSTLDLGPNLVTFQDQEGKPILTTNTLFFNDVQSLNSGRQRGVLSARPSYFYFVPPTQKEKSAGERLIQSAVSQQETANKAIDQFLGYKESTGFFSPREEIARTAKGFIGFFPKTLVTLGTTAEIIAGETIVQGSLITQGKPQEAVARQVDIASSIPRGATTLFKGFVEQSTRPEGRGEIAAMIFGPKLAGKTIERFGPTKFTGKTTSEITVRGRGVQEYTGAGQEVNPPLQPDVIKYTEYTEQVQGFRGILNDAKVTIIEDSSGRVVTKYIPETEQTASYQYSAFIKKTPAGTFVTDAAGVPIEKVVITKGGRIVKSFEQPAEQFGRVQATTNLNVFKGEEGYPLQETTTRLVQEGTEPVKDFTTKQYRTDTSPDKSIVTQAAGEERILKFDDITGGQRVKGTISVGTEAKAISTTQQATFTVEATDINRVFTETTQGISKEVTITGPEKVLGGTSKITLKVAEGPLSNEFTKSINRPTSTQTVDVTPAETSTLTQEYTNFAGVQNKPFIETAGQKTVNIAGTLELQPITNNPLTALQTANKALNTVGGKAINKITPYLKNPEELFLTPFNLGKRVVPGVKIIDTPLQSYDAIKLLPETKQSIALTKITEEQASAALARDIAKQQAPLPDTPTSIALRKISYPEEPTTPTGTVSAKEVSKALQQETVEVTKLQATLPEDVEFSIPTQKTVTRGPVLLIPKNNREAIVTRRAVPRAQTTPFTNIQSTPTTTVESSIAQSKLSNINKANQISTPSIDIASRQSSVPAQVTTPTTVLTPTQVTSPTQITSVSQVTTPTQVTLLGRIGTPRFTTDFGIPEFPEPIVPITRRGSSGSTRKKRFFKVGVVKGGKIEYVNNQPLDLLGAASLGKKIDLETLRASFTVEPLEGGVLTSEERAQVEQVLPKGVFRPSKARPGFYVQQAAYRLSSPTEKLEIQQAKRNSPFRVKTKNVFR